MGEALGLQRRFVADASHELRTPLTVLHTRAQLLRRRLAGQTADPATRDELDRLVRDAQSLGEVVTDLLLAAELEHAPQRGEPVDVGAVAREVVASLSVLADEREVALTTSGTDDGVDVVGIEAALRRALTALVDNALAHTGSGGPRAGARQRVGGGRADRRRRRRRGARPRRGTRPGPPLRPGHRA